MQGLPEFIPTATKTAYLQQLLAVGFDVLDFGSFVSPKAIPQLRDTAEVLAGLDLSQTRTRLLAIVANLRGAEQAASYPEISYLGFPLSVSATFQRRNTNQTLAEARADVAAMHALCERTGKTLVVYLSMGFGNPYGDPWSPALVGEFTAELAALGVRIVALSDTIGAATPEVITPLFKELIPAFPQIEFGAHLHATPTTWQANVQAAYQAGCRRFDSAMVASVAAPWRPIRSPATWPPKTCWPFWPRRANCCALIKQPFSKPRCLATRCLRSVSLAE